MNFNYLIKLLFILTYVGSCCCSSLLLSSSAVSAVFLSVCFVFKKNLVCQVTECCDKNWIRVNKSELDAELGSRVYGQPMVQRLSEAIAQHWRPDAQPSKALAIALHGPTGTGKNYAVGIIVRSLFKRAAKSRYYHFFSAPVHFPHRHLLSTYGDQLSEWIRGNVSQCPHSLFVFDEVDKLPAKLLDVLKPFMDYHEQISGVDYRRAIFIFLSNSGSELIVRKMVEMKRAGASRESAIADLQFDQALSSHAYNDVNSGLSNSALLQHHLISRFIPFLPLEREHVIGCINDYLAASTWHWAEQQQQQQQQQQQSLGQAKRQQLIAAVLDHLPFVPQQERFFSSAGCKRVVDKTLMLLQDLDAA